MKKQGYTILELLVSMSIFLVMVTMMIGAFVAITRMRNVAGNMKESQQKMRVAMELISRYTRQAEEVKVSTDKRTLDLSFNVKGVDPVNPGSKLLPTYVRFQLSEAGELFYYTETSCQMSLEDFNGSCTSKPDFSTYTPINLVSSSDSKAASLIVNDIDHPENNSIFTLDGSTIPPKLKIFLNSMVYDTPTTNDYFKLDSAVLLENIK